MIFKEMWCHSRYCFFFFWHQNPDKNYIKPSLSTHFSHCLAVASYHVLPSLLRNTSNLRKSEPACTSGSLLEHLSAFTSSKYHFPSTSQSKIYTMKGKRLCNQKVLACGSHIMEGADIHQYYNCFGEDVETTGSQNTGSNLSAGTQSAEYILIH